MRILLALLLAGWLPLAAAAERFALEVDADASRLRFLLGATLHTVEGSARIEPGARIAFDASGGAASGEVVVDATSADTGVDARDRNLHEQVLESERHPEIRFTAKRLEVTRDGEDEAAFVLHGDLAIHGGVHAVALSGRARGSLPGRVETRAETLLPYVEWGLEDVSNFLLSVEPEVRVVLEIEGDVTALPDGSPD